MSFFRTQSAPLAIFRVFSAVGRPFRIFCAGQEHKHGFKQPHTLFIHRNVIYLYIRILHLRGGRGRCDTSQNTNKRAPVGRSDKFQFEFYFVSCWARIVRFVNVAKVLKELLQSYVCSEGKKTTRTINHP